MVEERPASGSSTLYAPEHRPRLWCRRDGTGAGLPIVMLHGLGDSHDLWRYQVEPLSRRHEVLTLDLNGHGSSQLGPTDLTLEVMADDVRATIQDLGISRAVLVGLSMGGGVAQVLTLEHPELVSALLLVSTSSEHPDATRDRMLARADVAERDGMAAVVDATVPRWFTDAFMARRPDEVERTRHTVLATDPHAFAAASRANAVRQLTGRLGEIACPVLFIGGALDPADPPRAVETYRSHIGHFQWELVPDASHLVPVEAPSAVNHILLRFLDELEQANQRRGDDR